MIIQTFSNHSSVNFMISTLYDHAVYLTEEEYSKIYPSSKPIDVQSIVETPALNIFGKSGCTDSEQLTYVTTRMEDINAIDNNNIIKDSLRIFAGDNPARQFESGQQRGGNFGCMCGLHSSNFFKLGERFSMSSFAYRTIEEKREVFVGGKLWQGG